jgi:hypothetical protein
VQNNIKYLEKIQFLDSQITSWTADVASRMQLKKVKAIEMATWSQKLCNGLQKLGRAVCRIPVRFKLVTPDAADPALINAYANTCHLKLIRPLHSSNEPKVNAKF